MLHLRSIPRWIFLGINFAIIFFAIVIPLGRMMPKIIPQAIADVEPRPTNGARGDRGREARLSAVEAKLAGLDEEIEKFRAQVEQESLEDEKRIKASLGEESARIVAAAEQEIGVAAAQARRSLRNFAADLAIDAGRQAVRTDAGDRPRSDCRICAGVSADGAGKGGKN